VHDITNLEEQGLAAVFVASSEFVDAAEAQARALGATPEAVFVAHPIQDRSDEELQKLADGAVHQLLEALTADGSRKGA
jgi:hypothetical protein